MMQKNYELSKEGIEVRQQNINDFFFVNQVLSSKPKDPSSVPVLLAAENDTNSFLDLGMSNLKLKDRNQLQMSLINTTLS